MHPLFKSIFDAFNGKPSKKTDTRRIAELALSRDAKMNRVATDFDDDLSKERCSRRNRMIVNVWQPINLN